VSYCLEFEEATLGECALNGKIECLILLGADPLADVPDADLARRAMAGARRIIAVDTFLTASSRLAHVVLPAAGYAEKAGTTTNIEGRVTRVAQKVTVTGTSRPDWMIATEISLRLGTDLGFATDADITASISENVDGFEEITAEALEGDAEGLVAVSPHIDPINEPQVVIGDRNAYDFRLVVSRKLYDLAVGTAMSKSLAPLAPGTAVYVNPLDVTRIGSALGADVKVTSAKASVILPLAADESVQRGTAWVPFNQPGNVRIGDLIEATAAVTDVRIESL